MIRILKSRLYKQVIQTLGLKISFGNTVLKIVSSNNQLCLNCFRKQCEDEERKRMFIMFITDRKHLLNHLLVVLKHIKFKNTKWTTFILSCELLFT